MHSRADQVTGQGSRARGVAELVLRAVAMLALLLALLLELARPTGQQRVIVSDSGAASALPALSEAVKDPAVGSVRLRLASAPDAAARDLVRALRRSGVELEWNAPLPHVSVLAAEPLVSPVPSQRLAVAVAAQPPSDGVEGPGPSRDSSGAAPGLHAPGAGPPDVSGLLLVDDAGIVDSVPPGEMAMLGVNLSGVTRAHPLGDTSRVLATTRVSDSLIVRRVLVLGMAGWESRFLAAALEEAGWEVDARLGVAPTATVTQGVVRPDTARHSAVVVIDSSAAPHAAAIAEYARSGGGVVLLPDALSLGALRGIAPGSRGSVIPGESGMLASAEPRHGLPLVPVTSLRDGAAILETREGHAAVAARRVAAGRVAQVGFEDTWRWRFSADDGALAAHRSWWSSIVGSVAYAPPVFQPAANPFTTIDEAPAAAVVATLGAPTEAMPDEATAFQGRSPALQWWLFGMAALALLAEWASRRLRGLS